MTDPNTWSYHGFCERLSAIKALRGKVKSSPQTFYAELQRKIFSASVA